MAFAAARLRLELLGAPRRPDWPSAAGQALSLGLSGIVDGNADARKVAGVFALQDQMMAVRLVGRKLVAFHPDRDLKFTPERFGFLPDRLRVSVWSAAGKLVGKTERLARPFDVTSQPDRNVPAPDYPVRIRYGGVNATVTLSNI